MVPALILSNELILLRRPELPGPLLPHIQSGHPDPVPFPREMVTTWQEAHAVQKRYSVGLVFADLIFTSGRAFIVRFAEGQIWIGQIQRLMYWSKHPNDWSSQPHTPNTPTRLAFVWSSGCAFQNSLEVECWPHDNRQGNRVSGYRIINKWLGITVPFELYSPRF